MYPDVKNVWMRAAKELAGAEHIYVVGYSLPETDLFFKHLYSLGTVGKYSIRKFSVYNTDKTAFKRFRQLLGPGALSAFDPQLMNAAEAFKQINWDLERQRFQNR